MKEQPTTGQQTITEYKEKLNELLHNDTSEPIKTHKVLLEKLAVITTISEMTSSRVSSSDRLAAARLALEMSGKLNNRGGDPPPQVVLNFGTQVGDALAGISKLAELRYRHVEQLPKEDPDE